MAMEPGNKKWKLAFGDGSRDRHWGLEARLEESLLREVAIAKGKLGLDPQVPAVHPASG